MILALDPSSTCSGYAAMTDANILVDAGKIKPHRASDPANARIRAMAADVLVLVEQHKPEVVVVEDTSGKVARRHGGGGAGLAVYGKAIGWLVATLEAAGVRVVTVLENDWSRGQPKRRRQQIVAAAFKGYDAAKDSGGDVADAIALGQWWFVEGQYRKASAA